MTIKTTQELTEQAAHEIVAKHGLAHEDGESALEALCWELGSPVLGYVDGANALVAAAIKADRAQLADRLRETIRFHNDSGDANPEYLRGQVEMSAYLIGYGEPDEGDELRDDLSREAGR